MKSVLSTKMTKISVTLSSVIALVWMLPLSMGHLASAAHISLGDAIAFVSVLVSAGAITAEALEPWLIPFVGTLQGLILIVGVSAAAGW